MAAFNMDNGRHRNAVQVREGMASGERKPVTGVRISTRSFGTGESDQERRERHAQETGTRKSLWL